VAYRGAGYTPRKLKTYFLDNFLDQPNDRFLWHRLVLNNFYCILSKIEMKICKNIKGKFKQLIETYQYIVDEYTD
jgi:hypothetical protein